MTSARRTPELYAFFLVGPTASGKSAVAQWIAEHDSAFDLVSADAMLNYRGLEIGVAKPTPAERQRVTYWCVDGADPLQPFSVGDYRRQALAALRQICSGGRQAVVVGGTGLYVKCLINGLDPLPPMNPEVRARAERMRVDAGIGALHVWLDQVDPRWRETVKDPQNPRRLIRALELAVGEHAPPDRQWAQPASSVPVVGLQWPLPELYKRIEHRVRQMYDRGFLDEVRQLLHAGFEFAPTAAQAIGYAEAVAVVKGLCTVEEAMAQTVLRTRHLAKRQMTWFRHQLKVEWAPVTPDMTPAEIAKCVQALWQLRGPVPVRED